METPVITPPTAISRPSYDDDISLFSSAAAEIHHRQYFASSEEKENSLVRDVMEKYRQQTLEDEHSELTMKVKELNHGRK